MGRRSEVGGLGEIGRLGDVRLRAQIGHREIGLRHGQVGAARQVARDGEVRRGEVRRGGEVRLDREVTSREALIVGGKIVGGEVVRRRLVVDGGQVLRRAGAVQGCLQIDRPPCVIHRRILVASRRHDQAPLPADLATPTDLTSPPKLLTVNVGAGGAFFAPPNVVINIGDTVHWVWLVSGHNVVSGMGGVADKKFCSPAGMNCGAAPTSLAGTTYDVKFTQAGTYPYFCAPHIGAGMKGSVTVQ
ncbi:MAG: hypothetical protein EXR72_09530 [Myxococcales bacterium]|nr:hypothetical protein [Myxococcales bacterium]